MRSPGGEGKGRAEGEEHTSSEVIVLLAKDIDALLRLEDRSSHMLRESKMNQTMTSRNPKD